MLPVLAFGLAAVSFFGGGKTRHTGMEEAMRQQQEAMEKRHAEMDQLRQAEIAAQRRAVEATVQQMEMLKQQHAAAAADQKAKIAEQLQTMQEKLRKDQEEFKIATGVLQAKIAELQTQIDKPVRMRNAKVRFVNSLGIHPQQNGKITIWGQKGNGKSTFLWLWGKAPKPVPASDDGTKSLEAFDNYIDTIGLPAWDIYYVCKMLVLLLTHFGAPSDIIVCLNSDRIAHALTSLAFFGIISPLVVVMTPLKLYEGLNPPTMDPFSGEAGVPDIEFKEGENGVKMFPRNQLRKFYNAEAVIRIRDAGMGSCITHQDDPPKYPRPYCPFTHFEVPFEATETQEPAKELMFRFFEIYHRKYKDRPQGQLQFLHKALIQEFDEDI